MAWLGKRHLRAWRALLNAHSAAIRRINRHLADREALALEAYDVLLELFNAPDQRLRLNELGERVVLTRSGISRLVTRLEREGLVRRESVSDDGRGVQAALTPAGEEAFRRTWPLYAEGIRTVFAAHLTAEEADGLAAVLERIPQGSEDASPE